MYILYGSCYILFFSRSFIDKGEDATLLATDWEHTSNISINCHSAATCLADIFTKQFPDLYSFINSQESVLGTKSLYLNNNFTVNALLLLISFYNKACNTQNSYFITNSHWSWTNHKFLLNFNNINSFIDMAFNISKWCSCFYLSYQEFWNILPLIPLIDGMSINFLMIYFHIISLFNYHLLKLIL